MLLITTGNATLTVKYIPVTEHHSLVNVNRCRNVRKQTCINSRSLRCIMLGHTIRNRYRSLTTEILLEVKILKMDWMWEKKKHNVPDGQAEWQGITLKSKKKQQLIKREESENKTPPPQTHTTWLPLWLVEVNWKWCPYEYACYFTANAWIQASPRRAHVAVSKLANEGGQFLQ